jgi:hypothetical protein
VGPEAVKRIAAGLSRTIGSSVAFGGGGLLKSRKLKSEDGGRRAEDYYVSKTMIPFLRAELFFTL